jgi:ribonuclease P protein component
MLRPEQRLRRSADFALVTRGGRRARRGELVTYLAAAPAADPNTSPRAGLIVGKSVGNSVVRHRVSRRLRELLRTELALLSPGDLVVVRALGGAGGQTSDQLRGDLSAGLRKLRSQVARG